VPISMARRTPNWYLVGVSISELGKTGFGTLGS